MRRPNETRAQKETPHITRRKLFEQLIIGATGVICAKIGGALLNTNGHFREPNEELAMGPEEMIQLGDLKGKKIFLKYLQSKKLRIGRYAFSFHPHDEHVTIELKHVIYKDGSPANITKRFMLKNKTYAELLSENVQNPDATLWLDSIGKHYIQLVVKHPALNFFTDGGQVALPCSSFHGFLESVHKNGCGSFDYISDIADIQFSGDKLIGYTRKKCSVHVEFDEQT